MGWREKSVQDKNGFPVVFIYFIELPDKQYIKIGGSWRPAARFEAVANGEVSERVIFLGGFAAKALGEEMQWHNRWSHFRVPAYSAPVTAPTEWYHAMLPLRRAIEEALRNGPLSDLSILRPRISTSPYFTGLSEI